MRMIGTSKSTGFSLIELMIALGISAGVALVAVQSMVHVETSREREIASVVRAKEVQIQMGGAITLSSFKNKLDNLKDSDLTPLTKTALTNCRNGNGSGCDTSFGKTWIVLDTANAPKADVKTGAPIVDARVSTQPLCKTSSCYLWNVKIESGLAPLSDGTVHSSVRQVRVPNFLVTSSSGAAITIDFSCTETTPPGILVGIDYTNNTAICLSQVGGMPASALATGCGDLRPLQGFGTGVMGALDCPTPPLKASPAGATLGVQSVSLAGTTLGPNLGPATAQSASNYKPSYPTTAGAGTQYPTPIWQATCSDGRVFNTCIGISLAAYLSVNNCTAIVSQCPSPNQYDTTYGIVDFNCQCIGNSSGPTYCAASGSYPYTTEINFGPSYHVDPPLSQNVWYLDATTAGTHNLENSVNINNCK